MCVGLSAIVVLLLEVLAKAILEGLSGERWLATAVVLASLGDHILQKTHSQ